MTETCADCGEPINWGQPSYYRKDPAGDFGKTYHSECGDPFGTKKKDAEIGELEGLIIVLRQALEVIANPNNVRLDAGAASVARELQGVARAALSIPLPGDGRGQG